MFLVVQELYKCYLKDKIFEKSIVASGPPPLYMKSVLNFVIFGAPFPSSFHLGTAWLMVDHLLLGLVELMAARAQPRPLLNSLLLTITDTVQEFIDGDVVTVVGTLLTPLHLPLHLYRASPSSQSEVGAALTIPLSSC